MGIRKISVYAAAGLTSVALVASLTAQVMAATTIGLGTAASFSVLAGTAVTNVPPSSIEGDVGLSPASGSFYSGITDAQVGGNIYAVDGFGPAGSITNPGLLTTAKNDLTAAYIEADNRTPNQTFAAADNQLGGQTLTTGVYAFGHGTTANLTAAQPLVLDAEGNPDAAFIFQASSDLVTASGSVVQLINGAQACNVFWQVTSSATLGTGSTFVGTIMALTSNTITSGATINGRILSRNGAVTLDSDTITSSACSTEAPDDSDTGGDEGGTGGGSGSSGGAQAVPGVPNTSRSSSSIPKAFTTSL